MTQEQKKLSLTIAAGLFTLVILWFLLKRNATYTTVNNEAGNNIFGGVEMGGYNFTPGNVSFVIPAFGLPDDQFSMISGCCSDCGSKSAPVSYYKPVNPVELVFNEGSRGGTIYNYTQVPSNQSAWALTMGWG